LLKRLGFGELVGAEEAPLDEDVGEIAAGLAHGRFSLLSRCRKARQETGRGLAGRPRKGEW
jgi:hypothetical protein